MEKLFLQPILENEEIRMEPLTESDFDALYAIASDPKIWEQHPSKDRYKKEVFAIFFQGAMASGSAFKIIEKATGKIAGSTRYYDFDIEKNSIFIGYTFYATRYWGKAFNSQVKKLMLDYIFQYVEDVSFHVGETNFRSQIAVQRLGAIKTAEESIAYHGEQANINFIYTINRLVYNLNNS